MRAVCIDNHAFLGMDERGRLTHPRPDETLDGVLTVGAEYQVLGEEDGLFRVMTDIGEDYLFPKEMFRVVGPSEPN